MPDLTVVCNTSPLYYLHQIGRLDLLRRLYQWVVVPQAVRDELDAGARAGYDVPNLSDATWIRVRSVSDVVAIPTVGGLGRGEAEVIALGRELPHSLLVLDDELARRVDDGWRLRYTGTLGVLVVARRSGHLASVGVAVDELRNKGMWLSDRVVCEAIRLAGE